MDSVAELTHTPKREDDNMGGSISFLHEQINPRSERISQFDSIKCGCDCRTEDAQLDQWFTNINFKFMDGLKVFFKARKILELVI